MWRFHHDKQNKPLWYNFKTDYICFMKSWHIGYYLFYPNRLTHEYFFKKSLFKIVLEKPLRILWNRITSTINLFYSILTKAKKPTMLLPYPIGTYYFPYPYIFTQCSTSHHGEPANNIWIMWCHRHYNNIYSKCYQKIQSRT